MTNGNIAGSFRDPGGFLFSCDSLIYRQVNVIYKEDYDQLINSGLYKTLVEANLLIPHEEVDIGYAKSDKAYKIIKPELVPFISYPFEWCFSQLRDAALLTLKIQRIALDFGMSLKDGSAYNVQFRNGKPVFIDTLSFEKYHEGKPWVAYRQFCQHFLAPLALASYRDIRLNQLLRVCIDGIPLDLASLLLPFRTYLGFSLLSHIHLHAKSQKLFANKPVAVGHYGGMSRLSLLGLINNLKSVIRRLRWKAEDTEWANYYEDTNYSSKALSHKKQLVAEFISRTKPESVWDLGANVGMFSRIASGQGIRTISFDIDPACVEKNYLECLKENQTNILPLILDLTNPSPSLGWANKERMSLLKRAPADTVLALALIHHLAISNNLPFSRAAEFFSQICRFLIIEFVPKDDSQVQRLLKSREDIFPDYTRQAFESEFKRCFVIRSSVKIKENKRTLYLMESVTSINLQGLVQEEK
ncbi:SAM-dependent methyltransferase [bacterium]|nr:SAM-dependent methyltransferase [bacterium]MBU1614851.1 SAM-dependent methyltransferase [bacterium]